MQNKEKVVQLVVRIFLFHCVFQFLPPTMSLFVFAPLVDHLLLLVHLPKALVLYFGCIDGLLYPNGTGAITALSC